MIENKLANQIILRKFENNHLLIKGLSVYVSDYFRTIIPSQKKCSFVVPGGSTPKQLFKNLSLVNIDWSKLDITLTDERWVDISDQRSNERIIKKYLLQNKAASANFISLITSHNKPSLASATLFRRLSKMNKPLDMAILGMGSDGHIASLFPFDSNLSNALSNSNKNLTHYLEFNEFSTQRISLSFRFLNTANNKILYILGEEKLEVLMRALSIDNPMEMPICAFLKEPITIYWSPQK